MMTDIHDGHHNLQTSLMQVKIDLLKIPNATIIDCLFPNSSTNDDRRKAKLRYVCK